MTREVAELVSLFLSWPTIILGIAVLVIWGRAAIKSARKPPEDKEPMDWLLMGVTIGFFGGVLDNIYWGLAWSQEYLNHYDNEKTNVFFNIGVYFNIFFRQLCGTVAAYCHIKSYTEMKKIDYLNKWLWLISFLLGILYVFGLYAIR